MAAATVLVCGNATLDRLGDAVVPGGSAFYAAHALAALGARVRVFTGAASDLPRDALEMRGSPTPTATPSSDPGAIEPLVLPCPATTTFVNSYAASGVRSQLVLATAPPLDPAELPPTWRSADVLMLAPVLGEIDPAGFASAVRARVVGLCIQGLVRAVQPGGAVVARRFEPDSAALAGVSAAVLGEDEADGQQDLVARLASAIPIVVFTRGARGCDVLVHGRSRHVGIHPAREVDPTGAGDVFAAAFFLALARGDDPLGAARLGAAAASIVVEGRGGETLPRVGEAWERAPRVPVGPA
jgi:sugar/nucleoside kinase (ribokinase family)